jgi:hypothetical protein
MFYVDINLRAALGRALEPSVHGVVTVSALMFTSGRAFPAPFVSVNDVETGCSALSPCQAEESIVDEL